MTLGGPIFQLRLFGLLCPCMEKEEDKSARLSVQQLNKLGQKVDWHLGQRPMANLAGSVRNFFSRKPEQHTDSQRPTLASLRLVDATKESINEGLPYPELQLKPLARQGTGEDDETVPVPGGLLKRFSKAFQVDIPLHHIVRIDTIEPTMLVIITKDIHSVDEKKSEKEAARISFISADDRDAVCLDLKVLVEWNKQRQPEIEEEIPAEGIRARAQKAAHFARRELEMREVKRTREARKAKYVSAAGGLKYTAMAMANQSTES